MKIYDMKLKVLMLILNTRILNVLDYELEAHKSAQNQIYRLQFFGFFTNSSKSKVAAHGKTHKNLTNATTSEHNIKIYILN